MNPCPHCGSMEDGFCVRDQMAGPAVSYFNPDGSYNSLDLDAVHFAKRSRTVRCTKCGKVRKDVRLDEKGEIIIVEPVRLTVRLV